MEHVDGADALGKLTGIGCEAMKDLWERVKANQAKLDACPRHEFEILSQDGKIVARTQDRYRCIHCGGEIDSHAHYWHEQGRRP